jgi:hypothetical protein
VKTTAADRDKSVGHLAGGCGGVDGLKIDPHLSGGVGNRGAYASEQ